MIEVIQGEKAERQKTKHCTKGLNNGEATFGAVRTKRRGSRGRTRTKSVRCPEKPKMERGSRGRVENNGLFHSGEG